MTKPKTEISELAREEKISFRGFKSDPGAILVGVTLNMYERTNMAQKVNARSSGGKRVTKSGWTEGKSGQKE